METRLLDALPIATAVLRAGRVAYVNDAVCAVLRREASEIVGRPQTELIAPEDTERLLDRQRRRLRGEAVPAEYEANLLLPGGERIPCLLYAAADGEDIVVQMLDVRRRVEQRERLTALARLGAQVQQERSGDAIFDLVRKGFGTLGLSLVLARPDLDRIRIERADFGEYQQPYEAALGEHLEGVLRGWTQFTERIWHEGAAYADDWPLEVHRFMGGDLEALTRELAVSGRLTRAVGVRIEVAFAPSALLFAVGDWLRDGDLPAFRMFGAQVSAALEAARIIRELQAVNHLTLSVFGTGPGDTHALLESASKEIGRALAARAVIVFLTDEREARLRGAAGWGTPLPPREVALPLSGPSPVAECLRTQGPVQCEDTSANPRMGMYAAAGAPALSLLIVPFTSRRAARGVVAIAGDLGRRFGDAEVVLAQALAAAAAMGLENAELHAETRRRAEELGLLLEVGRSLIATLELKQVLDAGVRNLARMVNAPDAYLFLVDAARMQLEICAAAGTFPELVGAAVPLRPAQDSLAAIVFESGEPLVLEKAADHPGVHPDLLGVTKGSAYLGLPLVVRDRTIGVALIVDPNGPRRFSAAELDRATAIANQLAVAAENARLYDDVRRSYAELARAQAQLVQQERLAALGEMSAVVAHEVRNPLGVIFNSLGSLKRLLQPQGDARMLLDIVGEEADRLNRIVGDLLDFARPSMPTLRPEAVDRLLDEAVGAALGDNLQSIALEREIEPALPLVPMDARLMRQAILNIAVNAVQAMQHGGRLSVRALRDRGAVRIEIGDTGPGIPSEVRHRIFEPFFTTKPSGTGLGLAVVKRIIEGHQGQIMVESRPGQGIVFTIRLPLEQPAALPAPGAARAGAG